MNSIHPMANIHSLTDIETSRRGNSVSIGAFTVVDAFVKIKFAGGSGDVSIGKRCNLNSGTVIYSGHGVEIGDNVLIAANCTMSATNHEFKNSNMLVREQGFKKSKGGIKIQDDVWIGANCVILDGAVIKRGCIIAAGSIVRGTTEEYTIYGGSELRILGFRS